MKSFFTNLSPVLFFALMIGCGGSKSAVKSNNNSTPRVANIDLTNWKVTIPTPRKDGSGKPMNVEPPEILDYANNPDLKEFMYNDSTDGSIVFYTYPASSTANSSYSRSELREQMVSGSNNTNWTFKDGGRMKVTMSVPEVTKDEKGRYHRVIIAQIHGRLTSEQQELIGQKDKNAPPILKIYYNQGKIQVKTKVLKNHKAEDHDILDKKAWGDDEGYTFLKTIGKRKFTIEVIVSEGRMEIVLDGKERAVYKDKNMKRWGIFENYFKTGNYLTTRDKWGYAKVKIYDLEVSH